MKNTGLTPAERKTLDKISNIMISILEHEEFTTCHKCKKETKVQNDFNFCTHCLTHL